MVRAAAAQIRTGTGLAENAKKIKSTILEAVENGCVMILFHEGCLTGYPDDSRIARLDFGLIADIEEEIQTLAEKLGIAVLLGSTSRQDDAVYNDVLIIDESGRTLGRYAKTWRAGEPWYTAGSGPVIFRVAGIEATIMICHDLRFPELVRLGVAAGAQVIFIANNESGLTEERKLLGYRSMQISRATENLVYAVMANAPADPDNIGARNGSHGNSKIVDPLGNVLDEAGSFEERLVIASIDLGQASRQPVARTLGEDAGSRDLYGIPEEHPAYTAWMKEGLKLVKRLDGG
jgi:predicted amidohydrolase